MIYHIVRATLKRNNSRINSEFVEFLKKKMS